MGKLLITGDTHHDIDINKLTIKNFPLQKELKKDDVLVVLGDWGAIWHGDKKDNYILKWWEQKPWTTFVVLGNHCNYEAIEKLPIDTVFGAPVRRVSNSVVIAETGNIYNLCGKKCLVVNGADSHDKAFRKEGKSWWAQEKITQDDVDKALATLAQHNDKVDFVFTHTGGTEVCKMLGFSPTSSDSMLDLVLNTAEYNEHFCGHYHVDKLVDKTRVLYNDVMMIAADGSAILSVPAETVKTAVENSDESAAP